MGTGMKSNKQADPGAECVCVCDHTQGKRTGEYARHAEATNQPNPLVLAGSLTRPAMLLPPSPNELTSINHAGDSARVCVCAC